MTQPGRSLNRLRALSFLACLGLAVLASAPPAAQSGEGQAATPGDAAASAGTPGASDLWYRVERLNPGLGQPEQALDRETPQGTLFGFLQAIRDEDWRRAAHYLHLSELPAERQAEAGPGLARQLGPVVERGVWIDWSEIPDRPDALREGGGGNAPLAGQPRKTLPLATMETDGPPATIRLDRVKPDDGPAVWLFSHRSLRSVPQLYDRYGPGWLERKLPDYWRQPSLFSLYRWELAALPLAVGLIAGVLMIARSLLGRVARRLPWSWARQGAESARTPLALVAAAITGRLLLDQAVSFSGPVTAVLSPLLTALIVVGLTLAAVRAIDAGLDVVTYRFVGEIDDSESRDQRHFYTTIYAARRIVVLIAFVCGLGIVLSQFPMFESVGISLLASAGVLTVVLGIAGQTVLGNILSSLQIAIAKPIRIGDSVLYEGHWAYVESIFYTFVRLRTWDERRLIVPVRYFASHPFENWSMKDAKMVRSFSLHLDHDADVEALRERFRELAEADEDVMPDELLKVMVLEHERRAQVVCFYATAKDPGTAWTMHGRLREAMLAWIRDNHPEWWPRDRVVTADRRDAEAAAASRAPENS